MTLEDNARPHLEHAVEFAAKADEGSFFDYIILHGSVAKGTQKPESDIDFLLIYSLAKYKEKANQYFQHLAELFNYSLQSPVRLDLNLVERQNLDKKEFLKSYLTLIDDKRFYVNAFESGLVFDGKSFSRKAIESDYLKRCVERMRQIIPGI